MRISRISVAAPARGVALLSLALGAAAALSGASPIDYYVNQTIDTGSVTGYIETDGATGVLAQTDILGWNLLLNDGTSTFNLPGGILFGFSGSDLSATPTQLLFDFNGADNGNFLISDGSLDFSVCFSATPLSSSAFCQGAGETLRFMTSPAVFNSQFSSLAGTQAIAAMTLLSLQGGQPTTPILLPNGQPVGGVIGTIGGSGSQAYYLFNWAGGAFSATASISGTPNAGASYLFSEGGYAAGSCGSSGTATLSGSDSFTGTIAIANLPAGQYCVGINANNPNDPTFALIFNTPVTSTPEPTGLAFLLSIGLGVLGVVRLHRGRFSKP
ncbi:MAG: hypothetical protein ABSE86_11865 [Bryobacteraceae bacterium]|jgi:hypothetical protein